MTAFQLLGKSGCTGWWEIATRPGAARLRGLVRSYVGYQEDSSIPVRRKEVPTGDVSLILSFGPHIDVLDSAEPTANRTSLTSFVAAIGTSWALTEYTGAQYGIEVKLSPIGATMVLGEPMSAFSGSVVELTDVLGSSIELLADRLFNAPNWPHRFDILDEVLTDRLRDAQVVPPAVVQKAWRRLVDTSGRVAISQLRAELGCSHRHLAARFREYTGVAPKELSRVLRARKAFDLLIDGVLCGHVAHVCGYSDQPHLNRDLRLIAGSTPAELAQSRWSADSPVPIA